VKFTMNAARPRVAQRRRVVVSLGGDRCYRFTTGAYPFKCTPHGFTGTITVN
jgi:hypothetical protein